MLKWNDRIENELKWGFTIFCVSLTKINNKNGKKYKKILQKVKCTGKRADKNLSNIVVDYYQLKFIQINC